MQYDRLPRPRHQLDLSFRQTNILASFRFLSQMQIHSLTFSEVREQHLVIVYGAARFEDFPVYQYHVDPQTSRAESMVRHAKALGTGSAFVRVVLLAVVMVVE